MLLVNKLFLNIFMTTNYTNSETQGQSPVFKNFIKT